LADEHETEERTGPQRPPRLRSLARRIFREIDLDGARESQAELEDGEAGDPSSPESGEHRTGKGAGRGEREKTRVDPWALLGALLETGDKAKTEMVRMLAREVRSYLEALELHKDLHHLLTNYSLEVNASFNLKPLADAIPPSAEEDPSQPAPTPSDVSPPEDEPPSRND
jgi:hypothetical protein